MQLVIGGSRRALVQSLAENLAAAGHAVDGICHRLDLTPTAAQVLRPLLCLLVSHRQDGSCRDVAASVQQRSPGSFVLLLTDTAPADVWAAFDEELFDGVVSISRPFADLEAAVRATAAGSHSVVGFPRPALRWVPAANHLAGRN